MSGVPAIVLSGGGSRGAYEAGVMRGVVEALGLSAGDASPFDIFVGTSVGAVNVSYLAANAHRGDLNVDGLCQLWAGLDLGRHLDLKLGNIVRMLRPRQAQLAAERSEPALGGSFVDPTYLDEIIRNDVDWPQLRNNVDEGRVRALVVAALRISDGRTTMFADLAPGVDFVPSRDPNRHASCEHVNAEHVLASAAIPLVFPARRVGNAYYCDGGIRFNTPIAPAIRLGADRILVVSLRHPTTPQEHPPDHTMDYPSPMFLLGKLLDALLLDPIRYDLEVLGRFNRLATILEDALSDAELKRVDDAMIESRGLPYRKLETLVFEPSEDIGALAGKHIIDNLPNWQLPASTRWLLQAVARGSEDGQSDLASFILFDGTFAERIAELGYRDAKARADDVKRFFA
jgi:NTE family protein